MQKTLSRKQIQDILNQAPKDMPTDVVLKGLVDRGFVLEGFNEPKKETGLVREITADTVKPFENIANTVTDNIGAGAEHLGTKIGTSLGLRQDDGKTFSDRVKEKGQINSNITGFIDPNQKSETRDLSTFEGIKKTTGDVLLAGSNFIPVGEAAKGASIAMKVGKGFLEGAKIGATAGAGSALEQDKNLGGVVEDTLMGGGFGGAIGSAFPAIGGLLKNVKKTPSVVKDVVNEYSQGIDSPETIKSALNPFKTDSLDSYISVPQKDGLFVLKKVPDVTKEEQKTVQDRISDLYNQMLEKAKLFAKDRRDTQSPLEIVGKNTDKALDTVTKIRKDAGAKMGEIENKAKDIMVDLSQSPLNDFVEGIMKRKEGGYAGTESLTKETLQFLQDLDTLQQKGPSVNEVLKFTRDWNTRLQNLKDGFGKFKENAYDNSLISKMVDSFKNQARDTLSEVDNAYKNYVNTYRVTSNIRDEGNRLLGQDGMLGERIKGAATAKRAVQSNSDGGARQFYNKLKELTGYDGLQEADIAIQAMKNAGDYQGLSLLEVSKELLDKSGKPVTDFNVWNPFDYYNLGKKAVDYFRPNADERTRNFIKGGQNKFNKYADKSNTNPTKNTLSTTDNDNFLIEKVDANLNNNPENNPNINGIENNTNNASNIPLAVSNIVDSINKLAENGNVQKIKDLINGLTPYVKTQIIKYLTGKVDN